MRITLVINSLTAGGAEKILSLLANEWAKRGEEVTFVVFGDAQTFFPLEPSIRLIGLNLSTKGFKGISKFTRLIKLPFALRTAITESSPDHIVSFMDQANILTLIATFCYKVSPIVSERVNPEFSSLLEGSSLSRIFFKKLRDILYRKARSVVVQTEGAKKYFENEGIKNITVIPNPLIPFDRTEAKSPIPQPSIVSIGRLVRQKRFDLLIDAFSEVAERFPSWSLVIVGEGPLLEELKKQVTHLNLKSRVHFTGISKDIGTILSHASAFALTSDYEGFPGALCEAMSKGLPVIATDCPYGPSEIIQNGVNGLLVSLGDRHSIAEGIQKILGDPPLREKLGNHAKGIEERLSPEKIMTLWSALLKENRE